MSSAGAIALTVFVLAGVILATRFAFPRDLPLTSWLDDMPAPRLPRLPRVRRRGDGGRLAWKLWGLACKHPRVCPANAHSALIWHMRPWREIFIDGFCRDDAARNGQCWCCKLRDEPQTPPRAHGGTGDPCTGPRQPSETGARRFHLRRHGKHADKIDSQTGTAPPTPSGAVPPARMAPRGRHHAAQPLRLRLGLDGQYHHADTGAFTIPRDYGVIGDVAVMRMAGRMAGLP